MSKNLTIKSRLVEILKERGMTQTELAEKAGITQATISRFNKNNRYEISHIFAIARVLGIAVEELFEVVEENSADES